MYVFMHDNAQCTIAVAVAGRGRGRGRIAVVLGHHCGSK
jgi:hypothetical protein